MVRATGGEDGNIMGCRQTPVVFGPTLVSVALACPISSAGVSSSFGAPSFDGNERANNNRAINLSDNTQ